MTHPPRPLPPRPLPPIPADHTLLREQDTRLLSELSIAPIVAVYYAGQPVILVMYLFWECYELISDRLGFPPYTHEALAAFAGVSHETFAVATERLLRDGVLMTLPHSQRIVVARGAVAMRSTTWTNEVRRYVAALRDAAIPPTPSVVVTQPALSLDIE
jgi:hypothetical protein